MQTFFLYHLLQKRSLLTAIPYAILIMVSGSLPATSQPIIFQQEAKLTQSASDNLIPALLDDNSETRERAFNNLRGLGADVAVPALIQALQDKDWQMQAVAAYTLGRFGSDAKSAIPALSKAIKAGNADVRFVAAKALGEIGSEAVVPALIEALRDKDENVRVNAAESLKKIAPEAKAAVPALTNALWDGNWYVRSRAAATIAKLGLDAIDLPSLVEPWRNNDLSGIGEIHSLMVAIYSPELKNSEQIPLFFIKSLQNKDPVVRESAAIALGLVVFDPIFLDNPQKNEAVVDALIKSLKDKDAKVRQRGAEALGNVVPSENQPTLATQRTVALALVEALKDENAEVRQAVINSLYFYERPAKNSSAVIFPLLQALQDKDTGVRQSAAKILGGIYSQDYSSTIDSALIKTLQDRDAKVRQSAANALQVHKEGDFASNATVLALIKALQDEDEEVRQSAADALSGGVPDQFLLSAWIEILQQKDAKIEVRRSAAISISRVDEIKDVATLQALTQAFQDEDLGIRQNIAISLWKNKKLDTKNTLKILNEGLLSKDPFIQFDALEELDNIVQFNIHAGLGNMDEEMKPVLPSLITLLQSNIEPLRYSAALLISDIAPQKECVPVLHEILNKEREYPIPDIATDALLNIISSEALNAYIDSLKFTDKEQRYVLSCGGVYGVLGGFLKVPEFFPLLIQALNNENVRSIVASSIIKSDNLKIATPRLIKILENEYEGTPALKEILIFKDKDIRRSISYALGEIADSDANDDENREENRIVVKDKENEQKIINALTVVVQNQQEDIDIRWMTATSLQKLGINQDSFFTKYNLVNPSTIKCPFPFPYPLLNYSGGLVFDRYSAQCNYAIGGCGASLKGIYIKLRQRLSNRSLSNRSPSK